MKNLLGLGTAGSNIVREMSQYEQYCCYTIDSQNIKNTKFDFKIEPKLSNVEEYENLDTSKVDRFLSKIKNNLTVFVCGASRESALALRVLKPIYDRGVSISIVYFTPEREVLSVEKSLQERVVRNVLQQYARSGLFEDMLLVSNQNLESLAGPTNVMEYYNQLNSVFTSIYYMLDVFKNTKPVTSTFSKVSESCRIKTIGISSLETLAEEALLYPISDTVEITYYFGINEDKLKTEENLFRKITDKVKSRISENTKVSFGIYSTQYEDDYIYTIHHTPKIQELSTSENE